MCLKVEKYQTAPKNFLSPFNPIPSSCIHFHLQRCFSLTLRTPFAFFRPPTVYTAVLNFSFPNDIPETSPLWLLYDHSNLIKLKHIEIGMRTGGSYFCWLHGKIFLVILSVDIGIILASWFMHWLYWEVGSIWVRELEQTQRRGVYMSDRVNKPKYKYLI